MKKELIEELFQKFEEACYLIEDTECWSARELQTILGYAKWDNFFNTIEKAKNACEGAGEKVKHHFADVGNGRTRKWLSTKHRRPCSNTICRTENKLSGIIYERGVDEMGFAIIRSEGDKALFGGRSTLDMKRNLAIPEGRPLADFLPTLTIKAKDFAAELTSHNTVEKDLRGQTTIQREHVDNNLAVRRILQERGVRPEHLPRSEDVRKVERRLKSEEKKAIQKPDKIKNISKSNG